MDKHYLLHPKQVLTFIRFQIKTSKSKRGIYLYGPVCQERDRGKNRNIKENINLSIYDYSFSENWNKLMTLSRVETVTHECNLISFNL